MMRRCRSTHGNVVGVCSCGMYHSHGGSFCMLLSLTNGQCGAFDEETMYSYNTSSLPLSPPPPSSSVDCTLSLGTPSTRLARHEGINVRQEKKRTSCISSFGWSILPTSKHTPSPFVAKNSRNGNAASGGDPLLARRCANCDATSTPLWRNGPRGPKSLCNACGIRFKKEERRATAAVARAAAAASTSNGGCGVDNQQCMMNWIQPQKTPCHSSSAFGSHEFQFIDDLEEDNRELDNGGVCWRCNVTDRPNLVHDFTR